jgi:hypothetical protein
MFTSHPHRLSTPISAAVCAAVLALAPPARADVQIILHAIDHPDRVHCYLPVELGYRDPVVQTRTAVEPHSEIDVFVYLRGYGQASGAGVRLVWPADWEYFGWVGDCLPPAQITIADFQGNSIDLATAFDDRTGEDLLPLGFASFRTGASGEVMVLGTRYCIVDAAACYVSQFAEYPIPLPMLGRVAAGGPGYNPAAVFPVEESTWGSIKASYKD